MNIYLVGGAVRDQLLGYPHKERDWVVVGSTPDELLKHGYQQVGRDFPVFLHPETREEYALARTERKKGIGYYGFLVDFNPRVTLEEDLFRRDLTINAMAMGEDGKLVDPYGGQDDLRQRYLRHVSPAFVEDPVRVLRVARFAARYHHLGFQLAPETRALMVDMVRRGELEHLVPERVWQEWQCSLQEKNPEQFITTLRACGALRVVLPELDALFGIPNPREHHPEVDTGIHALAVLSEATCLSEDPMTRFASLLHDVGKACTPIQEWPVHHGHEQHALPVINKLCVRLRIPVDYRKLSLMCASHHLNIHRLFELRPSTVVSVFERTDAFRRPEWFERLLLTCEADAKAKRGGKIDYIEAGIWRNLLKACAKLTAKPLIEQGFKGESIKQKLHELRVVEVKRILERQ